MCKDVEIAALVDFHGMWHHNLICPQCSLRNTMYSYCRAQSSQITHNRPTIADPWVENPVQVLPGSLWPICNRIFELFRSFHQKGYICHISWLCNDIEGHWTPLGSGIITSFAHSAPSLPFWQLLCSKMQLNGSGSELGKMIQIGLVNRTGSCLHRAVWLLYITQ